MSPIKGGFRPLRPAPKCPVGSEFNLTDPFNPSFENDDNSDYANASQHAIPDLERVDIDAVVAAAHISFHGKLSECLEGRFTDKSQQLQVMGPLVKIYACYEKLAMEPEYIRTAKFNTRKLDELEPLLYGKKFEAIGDFVLQEYKEDVEMAKKVAVTGITGQCSPTEDESSGSNRRVLLPDDGDDGDDKQDDQNFGGRQGGVSLYRTSASPERVSTLDPIDEDDDEGPVFL